MKNINKIAAIATTLLTLGGCAYEDYILNEYEYTAVSFAIPDPVRTIIDGSGDYSIKMGVTVGGIREVEQTGWATYVIDETLLEPYPDLEMLPEECYTLSDESTMYINPGYLAGWVDVDFDMEKLMALEGASGIRYAIPMRITDTSFDQINSSKDYTITVVKYINSMHGVYARRIDESVVSSLGSEYDTALYWWSDDINMNETWELTTQELTETEKNQDVVAKLKTPTLGSLQSSLGTSMMIKVSSLGAVTLSDIAGEGISNLSINSEPTYDADTRTLYLNYNFDYTYDNIDATSVTTTISGTEYTLATIPADGSQIEGDVWIITDTESQPAASEYSNLLSALNSAGRPIDLIFESILKIQSSTLKGAENLTSVTASLATDLQGSALQGCVDLESVSLPMAVSLRAGCMSNCPKLTSLTFGTNRIDEGTLNMKYNAFIASNTDYETLGETDLSLIDLTIGQYSGSAIDLSSSSDTYHLNDVEVTETEGYLWYITTDGTNNDGYGVFNSISVGQQEDSEVPDATITNTHTVKMELEFRSEDISYEVWGVDAE